MHGNGMGPDAPSGLVIGPHASGPAICGHLAYPQKGVTRVVVGDLDRGLDGWLLVFCANVLGVLWLVSLSFALVLGPVD